MRSDSRATRRSPGLTCVAVSVPACSAMGPYRALPSLRVARHVQYRQHPLPGITNVPQREDRHGLQSAGELCVTILKITDSRAVPSPALSSLRSARGDVARSAWLASVTAASWARVPEPQEITHVRNMLSTYGPTALAPPRSAVSLTYSAYWMLEAVMRARAPRSESCLA